MIPTGHLVRLHEVLNEPDIEHTFRPVEGSGRVDLAWPE